MANMPQQPHENFLMNVSGTFLNRKYLMANNERIFCALM